MFQRSICTNFMHIKPQQTIYSSEIAAKFKADMKRYIQWENAAIFFLSNLIVAQLVACLLHKAAESVSFCNHCMWIHFSFVRYFKWLNYPPESNSYHKTSLSMIFGCWHLSGILLCPLHFVVYTIAWQRNFATKWVLNTKLYIFSG